MSQIQTGGGFSLRKESYSSDRRSVTCLRPQRENTSLFNQTVFYGLSETQHSLV